MNVLFIANTDWTNYGYHFSQALNSVGVESYSAYKNDNAIGPLGIHFKSYDDIRELVENADAVVISHTTSPINDAHIENHILSQNKKLLVLHGGSKYRQNVEYYNKTYNNRVDATLASHDLMDRGAKNEKIVVVPVDTDFLQPIYHHRDKLIVVNYPTQYTTRPHLKGADKIVSAMEKLCSDGSFEFRKGTDIIPWADHIDRIKDCDIYIESIGTKQEGVPLTMYGVIAAEAAALGKIVIGKFDHYENFAKDFKPCKILNAYDEESLTKVVEELLSLSKGEILELQKESREWAVSCHSYKTVGTHLKNIIGEL